MNYPTLSDIEFARTRVAPFVKETPLARSRTLSSCLVTNVYLKYELFQNTGSFKVRGAFNKMLTLSAEEEQLGIVTLSGGNHAVAVSYAARELGIKATIFLPEMTPRNYVEATRGYGANTILTPTISEAFERVTQCQAQGLTFVHPFDDPLVIAGQGTMGLEIIADVPHLTDLIVSIGGGGMLSGVATAIKSLKPEVRIWGVETEGANCMSRALAAGKVVQMPAITSIAKTLGAPAASELTLSLARKYLEGLVVVSDQEAVAALHFILERLKVLTEPAASCTLAAADRLRENFTQDDHVVLILCGGNVALQDVCGFDPKPGTAMN